MDIPAVVIALGETGLLVVLIIVTALVCLRVASRVVRRASTAILGHRRGEDDAAALMTAEEFERRIQTIAELVLWVARIAVVAVAFLLVLDTLGIDVGPLIASLGLFTAALALGAQGLVRDYVNGILIVVERHFSRGDVVRLAGVAGRVEDFNLRRTTLRDLDGVLHVVPNGAIVVASNLTRGWASIRVDVSIQIDSDLDRAIAVVNEVGAGLASEDEWAERILEAPVVDEVSHVGSGRITIRVLGKVRADDQWAAEGELRRRLVLALRGAGVALV